MARLTGDPYERVYAAADLVKQHCLVTDGCLLVPGTALWTEANLRDLDNAMDDGGGTGSFTDRFKRQLAQMTPEVRRLAGEMVLVQYLFPSDFKFASKLRNLRVALGDLTPDTLQLPIVQALDGGIGGANPGFNLFRYQDMKALIRIFHAWRQMPGPDRPGLLSDPWAFRTFVDSLPQVSQRGSRHALLHILFPEAFERIASTGQKRQILSSFASRIHGQATGILDQDIARIRQVLEQERGAGFDFYSDPVIRAQWMPDDSVVEAEADETTFYWLNTPPSLGSLKDLAPGERLFLPQNSESGPRSVASCFIAAKPGDRIAGYEISPRLELTTLLRVVQALQDRPEGPCLELEVTGKVEPGKTLDSLRTSPHFTSSGTLVQRGTFSRISKAQFEGLTGFEVKEGPEAHTADLQGTNQGQEELFVDPEEVERWVEMWRSKKNLILQGPPGTGKTFIARHLAKALAGTDDPARIQMIQFHQAYGYEDFVMGYRPTKEGGFEVRKGFFHQFRDAAMAENTPFVLIIDEINRGNLSKIFGETLMLIEADKRKERYGLRLALHQEEDPKFFIPSNLYILGLMNNSDRSLAVVDYALRRRFSFVNLHPAFESEFGREAFSASLRAKGADENLIAKVVGRVRALNGVIAADLRNLGPDLCLGHSFFCEISSEQDYLHVIDHEIAPLLREYWFDNPNQAELEVEKLKA